MLSETYYGQTKDWYVFEYGEVRTFTFQCVRGYDGDLTDENNNGIPDALEYDTDGDGIWDYYDDYPLDNNNDPADGDSHAPPDSINPDAAKTSTEEPINFITGNNYFSAREFSIPTSGIPLTFARTYNSTSTNLTTLGTGWRHTYEWAVDVHSNQCVVTDGKGSTCILNKVSVSSATP